MAGVSLGAYLQSEALRAVAGSLVPVLLVSAGTLAISLAAGAILARTTPLDPPTAALGMIAGGASGIVGMSGELGADDRLVRSCSTCGCSCVLLTPIGIVLFFGGEHGAAPRRRPPRACSARGGAGADGRPGARRRVGGGPVARHRRRAAPPDDPDGAVVLAGLADGFAVPDLLGQTAFALIGLQVGCASRRRRSGCSGA